MKSLVILAAGMGSRFGGLKQIEPLGPNGEFIIDYSIHDAIKAGFDKVVFIIKEENYDIFKNTIGSRVEGKIEVEYAFQKNDLECIPSTRVKPLGTAHAILCAEDKIDGPFMIINADDYYGIDAINKGFEFLNDIKENNYGLVAYRALNTITENGSVKRGVININNGYLSDIVESKLEITENGILMLPLSGSEAKIISNDTLVSMNMMLFDKSIFKYIHEDFDKFLSSANLEEDEFLIPSVLDKHIKSGDITVKIIDTTSVWHGVTYKEDASSVRESLAKMHTDGIYNKELWK